MLTMSGGVQWQLRQHRHVSAVTIGDGSIDGSLQQRRDKQGPGICLWRVRVVYRLVGV